ncbi:protein NRT1/ PTR FAMILY 3.1-like [Henckelia pumila]|uniref:protein NRT1/ PTR FAMILY 3.1-like n=1 Tax=Henckelia pumila TaxID=405737 RepID=UPI003C6E55B3
MGKLDKFLQKGNENGDNEEEIEQERRKRKLGGVRTMPFILANEMCDRFAGAGFHANMITYLTQVLNLPLVKASNTITTFGGTSNFTPLLGAFIADSFAGRFWTIIVGSIIYRALDADISTTGRLLYSNQFKWFDRAAVVSESDTKEPNKPNLWRLATVQRVEELKSIIRLLPIWSAYILLVVAHSHQVSFTIQQARTMNRRLSPSFQIPPASMSIFSSLTFLIGIPLYERLFVPFSRKFTNNPVGITYLQRMGIGFAINIFATAASALVEIKRKKAALDHNLVDKPAAIIPISVFWLLPQYCLHGLAEIFYSVGHMEFLYDQSPESMRSTASALNWIGIGFGNYISTLVVALVHKYSGRNGRNWLPDRNLNRGRLENYYWLVTGIQVVNLIYYVLCAWFYKYKPIEEMTDIKRTDEDLESDNGRKLIPNGDKQKKGCGDGDFKEETKEEDHAKVQKRKLGGLRTMPFILANEMCDRFAGSGFQANMITYLTQVLNLPLVKASNIITTFVGTSNFTPLLGAFIADSFAGRFWTIIVGSIIYVMGMVALTVSAILPRLRPSPCPTQVNCQEASSQQLWILYMSLFLMSLGAGGTRPCAIMFGADQFDMTKSKVESRTWNFFNWYYFCLAIASFLALTIVVYIQDNISWGWGLGIPTIVMALSIVAFILGSPLYRKIKPPGSPFVRLAQVVVAAAMKREAIAPDSPNALYENKDLDADISTTGRLLYSNQFKWLDRAAVVSESDMSGRNQPNLWRLATVHRVEELKTIIRIIPLWAAYILVVAAQAHQNSFTIQQARTMNRHLSPSFQIPPASMTIFSNLTFLLCIPIYERLLVPFARKFTKNPVGITYLQRMGIGFAINVFATGASALVEIKRKKAALDHNLLDEPVAIIPISVFWLLPQYCIHGLAEMFYVVGHIEFLYDQSPESMKSTAAALNWISIGIGNYISTLVVALVHKYSGRNDNWLPDRNLNRGRLENYYWLVTGIQVVNMIYYVVCAWFYEYKTIEKTTDIETRDTDEDLESDIARRKDDNGDKFKEVELVQN